MKQVQQFKAILLLLVIITLSTSLYSQQTDFGVKAGLNLSSIEMQNGPDYDSKTGLHVGGVAHIHLSRYFALQPELVYSCQGGELFNYKLSLGYLNVPILLQYMMNKGFRLQTGPQVGFLMNAEQKGLDFEVDVDPAYNSIDFAWVLGAGYLFKGGIGVDLRYNIGLADITDSKSSVGRNRVLQLGLFYQFKNNKRK